MRVGDNLARDKIIDIVSYNHRVIIPLYIPHLRDYYSEALEIFELCLISVNKTTPDSTVISVISNGCCQDVNDRLLHLYRKGFIDELIIEKDGIGKINSILKALRTAKERFITISDADILFCKDWLKETLSIFNSFPKAAAVSPMPVFRTQNHYTSNILFDYLFSNKIGFSPVKNPIALTRFAKSIGWTRLDNKWKDFIMTLKANSGNIAIIGCNHSVVTYKTEIFNDIPKESSKYRLGGDSEGIYLDRPALNYDGYRLATYDNFAYHMGNKIEPWMREVFEQLENVSYESFDVTSFKLKRSKLKYLIKNVLFKKILSYKKIRKLYYSRKGLASKKLNDFT